MIAKKAVGFIIFIKQGRGIRYLLLHHGGDYWNFPKGRVESGESELETAQRELLEETGIADLKIVPDYGDGYDYDFDSVIENGQREKVHRTAVFFLAEVDKEDVKISDEHLDFGWFDFETALKRMYYQEGQNMLKRAHQYLLKQSDFVL